MPETLVYLSDQWREEAEKRLAEELTPDVTNNASISMANCYCNCPDGNDKYVYFSLSDGKLDAFRIGTGEVPEADLSVIADYWVHIQMAKQELSAQSAMMSGKLKLKGNMMKAMKYAPLSDRVTKVFSSIPTEYV